MQKSYYTVPLIVLLISSVFMLLYHNENIDNNNEDVDDIAGYPIVDDTPIDEDKTLLRDEYGIHYINITEVWFELEIDAVLVSTFIVNYTSYIIDNLTIFPNDFINESFDGFEVQDFNSSYIVDEIIPRHTSSGYTYALQNNTIDTISCLNITYIEPHDGIMNFYIERDTGLYYRFTFNDVFGYYDEVDHFIIQAVKYRYNGDIIDLHTSTKHKSK